MGKHEMPSRRGWLRWWPVAGLAAGASVAGGAAVEHPDASESKPFQSPEDTLSLPKVQPLPSFSWTPSPTAPRPPAVHRGAKKHRKPHRKPPAPARRPSSPPPTHHHPNGSVGALVAFLEAQVGKRYVWGGNGPDAYDCSGLSQQAMARVGVRLPRTSEEQSLIGARVGLDELRPGDLLFWGSPGHASHVAVYIGGGHYIAAENPRVGVVNYSIDFYRPDYGRRVI